MGKDNSLERENYRGMKLTDQILKIAETIIGKIIRQEMGIDKTQLGFLSELGTTNPIFILRQLRRNV